MEDRTDEGLERQYRTKSADQNQLFDIGNSWMEHWWGMPEYHMRDAQPQHSIIIQFMNYEDILDFAKLIDISVTRTTRSAWFPKGVDDVDSPSDWEWADES